MYGQDAHAVVGVRAGRPLRGTNKIVMDLPSGRVAERGKVCCFGPVEFAKKVSRACQTQEMTPVCDGLCPPWGRATTGHRSSKCGEPPVFYTSVTIVTPKPLCHNLRCITQTIPPACEITCAISRVTISKLPNYSLDEVIQPKLCARALSMWSHFCR